MNDLINYNATLKDAIDELVAKCKEIADMLGEDFVDQQIAFVKEGVYEVVVIADKDGKVEVDVKLLNNKNA